MLVRQIRECKSCMWVGVYNECVEVDHILYCPECLYDTFEVTAEHLKSIYALIEQSDTPIEGKGAYLQ